jgi:hypothetical protein
MKIDDLLSKLSRNSSRRVSSPERKGQLRAQLHSTNFANLSCAAIEKGIESCLLRVQDRIGLGDTDLSRSMYKLRSGRRSRRWRRGRTHGISRLKTEPGKRGTTLANGTCRTSPTCRCRCCYSCKLPSHQPPKKVKNPPFSCIPRIEPSK